MKYDYYIHRSCGFCEDYFGRIGDPVKISFFKYYVMKLRYRTTKVLSGSSLKDVLTQALNNSETQLDSYSAKKLYEKHGV